MDRRARVHTRSTLAENLRTVLRFLSWKLLLLLPILLVFAVPTYLYGLHFGNGVVPSLSHFFDVLSAPAPPATPTPLPVFPTAFAQAGSILYTIREGDSCDSILTFQMYMGNAGEIFSDVKPQTVQALNTAMGQNCHAIQPGMVVSLSPHYPLTAFGGIVHRIEAATPQQVLPTPLIPVPDQEPSTVNCSRGCLLTVELAPQVNIHLVVKTTLSIRIGSWVWAQAMMPRKAIQGFDNYPYVDPQTPLAEQSFKACDLQVDNVHDDNSLSCDQLAPNTIDIDGGSWLLGVTGSGGLDHWGYHYPKPLPPNTQVLLWLSSAHGNLVFKPGNAAYRYNQATHLYERL